MKKKNNFAKQLRYPLTLFFFFLTLLTVNVQIVIAANEFSTDRTDRTALAISLYQHDLALIKDVRNITLSTGTNHIEWQEISAKIQPETAWISYLTHPEQLHTVAQQFNLNTLTPQQLLESQTGKSVTVIRSNSVTGEEYREDATVLTTNGGVILQFSDRIETGVPGRLAFSEIPENLRNEPAMVAIVNNSSTQGNAPQSVRLTYLTHGLSWHANYILTLDQQERHASLTGLATLTNQSGIDYQQASIQLIAGDINQARQPRQPRAQMAKRFSSNMEMASFADDIEAIPHAELYRYQLQQKVTLHDNQHQQITFMSVNAIPVEKQFILTGHNHYYLDYYQHPEQKQAVDVFINFRNSGDELGVPLPSGIIRAYQHDQQNDLHFIGEDNLNHTPTEAIARIRLGKAFDVTAEKKQTDFKRIPSSNRNLNQSETTHEITLYNAKKEAVTVIVRESIPGDWRILSESQPHQKTTAQMAEWHIEVPAENSQTLTYRVSTKL